MRRAEELISDENDLISYIPDNKHDRWNHRNALPYTQLVRAGIKKWGKYRYEDDGFVYVGRSKRPIGRYLRIVYFRGNSELALKSGRLEDVHELEAMRWRILTHIKDVLVPIVKKRSAEVKAHGREGRRRTGWFHGWVDDVLYRIRWAGDEGVHYEEVDTEELEKKGALDQMAANHTSAESDMILRKFIEISDRLHRAWLANGTVTGLMLKALDEKLRFKTRAQERRYGGLAEVEINGRVYMTWLGQGGMFKNSEELTRMWPCPMNRHINLDKPLSGREAARYKSSTDGRKHTIVYRD